MAKAGAATEPAGAPDEAVPFALAGALTGWITASEAVFLEVGERLGAVHRRVSAVREGIQRSTDILATPEMTEMRASLSGAADRSRRIQHLVGERRATLAAIQSAIADAAGGGEAVRLVFRTLDYVVLIARAQIEGMRSGQDDLVPFALHVDELVTSGTNTARYIEERMSVLSQTLDESRAIEAKAQAGGAQDEMLEGFLRLIALIETEQAAAAAQRSEAQSAFTAVWKAVGGVVMGLQAHDMARQRFEHTARNLAILERLAEDGGLEDGGEPLPPALRPAAMRRILALEAAQTDDLAATYLGKMAALDGDLSVVGRELEACSAILLGLAPTTEGKGLNALEAQAERLRIGFRRGDETRRRLSASLDRSVEATSSLVEMTEKLTELEYDLRLAGFNAAVRAAHIEGGDETIGYIASVIREQASRAREEADRVREGIEAAIGATQRLSGEILPEVTAAEAAIEAVLGAANALLVDAESESRAALADSGTAADGLSGEVAAVRALMASHEEGHAMMCALSAALAAAEAGLPEDALPGEVAERLDRHLVAPYTMEEERDVYARLFGAPVPGRAPPSADAAVDLFDETPAAQPAAAAPADDFDDILF